MVHFLNSLIDHSTQGTINTNLNTDAELTKERFLIYSNTLYYSTPQPSCIAPLIAHRAPKKKKERKKNRYIGRK